MQREKLKGNNKGFSLVELIIVIAIMAILVAILAPQFLKYVERSRNSADVANAREITNAIAAYAADEEATTPLEKDKVTEITINTKTNIGTDNKTAIEQAMTDAGLSPEATKCKSKTAWTEYKIIVNVGTDGTVTFKYSPADFAEKFSASKNGS
ncbi:MAG: type II secretion system GspH family protein [Lachnospiraceae bacterium]|nr:type II secretion system GspH family protein [Lachnospiraceae bacterium]